MKEIIFKKLQKEINLFSIGKWIFYILNLYCFYFIIIWNYGNTITAKCQGNWKCARFLQTTSWNYSVDLSDNQWREFRNSLPLLIGIALGSSLVDRICYKLQLDVSASRTVIGIVSLFIQHKFHSLIIFVFLALGYGITQKIKSPTIGKTLTWMLAIFILFFKESYLLIRYFPQLNWLRFLNIFFDSRYSGMYNWRLPANFFILRLISYNIDYYNLLSTDDNAVNIEDSTKSVDYEGSSSDKKMPKEDDFHNEKSKKLQIFKEKYPNNQLKNYSSINYLSYMLYIPLYMAGPIISYHSYLNYLKQPQNKENILIYFIRFVYCFALMEFLLFKFPFFAIISSNLLVHLTLIEIFISFYMVLKLMWLKFLLLWRFFRLWSLLDGVNPPENMQRCMSNNYSLGEFWKYWHSSYNQWLISYLYIPLGGKYYSFYNVWIIFFFVAIWHDIEWKLICWGFLNAFFYVIERFMITYVRKFFIHDEIDKNNNTNTNTNKSNYSLFARVFDSFFGAVNIMILILVNLIGYSLGTGAISLVSQKLFTWEGMKVVGGSLYFLFIGVNIMFSIQEMKDSWKDDSTKEEKSK